MTVAFDEGADFFKSAPDLLVAAVWHEAARYTTQREAQMEFVNGYIWARRQQDEFRREKQDAGTNTVPRPGGKDD